MLVLDLDFNFVDLDGKEIPGDMNNASKAVAKFLSQKNEVVELSKAMSWANQLYKTGSVELDKSDLDTLEKYVKQLNSSGTLFNIAAHPIVEAIDNVRRDSKEKEKDKVAKKAETH